MIQMLRRTILIAMMVMAANAVSSLAAERPNIVVILADDLGWNAVGYHNAEYQTPNIDSLVADGIELNRFYVAPMCSPTRAGFMTGRYPIRFGCARAVIPPYRDFGLPNEETTIAEALSSLGYHHRGVFGKWHLGHRRAKWHPLDQGFTHFHGHYNGAIDYFRLTREDERDWHVDFQPSDEQGYSTDLIARAAATWIRQVASDDGPYFCYVPFNAPHSPFQAPEEAIAKFTHFSDDDAARKQGTQGRQARASRRQIYAAMIWKMDQGIGQILEAIDATGEAERTIVWFFSDNGGVGNIRENNQPLRGSKLTVYEGGTRVPACIRWPDRIQPGSKSNLAMGYIDMLPTLVAAAGGEPETATAESLDGFSLLPILIDSEIRTPESRKLSQTLEARPWYSYHGQSGEMNEHLAVTVDGWKLKVNGARLRDTKQLMDGTNEVELFHLAEDALEQKEVKEQHPDKVQLLGKMLVAHRALQPERSVPGYGVGRKGFVPPPQWKLDPEFPNKKVGTDAAGN
jgi:arylsulfatase B